MIIESIETQGYGSYRDFNTCEIPLGITGIIGSIDNQDDESNGCGKTTFIMIVIYVLYGEGEFTTLSELVNDQLEENTMYAKLSLVLNSNKYLIERGINKGSSYLDVFENGNKLGSDMKTSQEAINAFMGMDYSMFSATVFFEQNNMDKFIKTQPDHIRQYINKVFGLENWQTLLKNSNKRIKTLQKDIENLEKRKEELSLEIENINKVTKEKSTMEATIQKIINEKNSLNKDIDKYYKYKNLQDKIVSLETELEKNKKLIEECVKELDIAKKVDYIKAKEDIKNSIKNNELIIKQKESTVFISKATLKERENSLEENTLKIDEVMSKLSDTIVFINTKQNDIKNVFEGICPTCLQEANKNLLLENNNKRQLEINELTKIRLDKEDIISTLKQDSLNLKESVKKIRDSLEMEKNELNNILFLNASMEKELNALYNTEKLHLQRIAGLEKSIEDTNNMITYLTTSISDSKLQLPVNFEEDIISINVLKSRLERLEKDLSDLNIEYGRILQSESSIKEKNILLESLKKEIVENNDDLYISTVLSQAYATIPQNDLKNNLTLAENYSNEYIQKILPYMSVSIYEDDNKERKPIVFSFKVRDKIKSYKRLSGGQKVIANIGLRLGFSKVIMERSGTNIEFVAMDEPFGALDEKNRGLVKSVLSMMSEYYKQILVITHTKDANDFPNLLRIDMTPDGVSFIN